MSKVSLKELAGRLRSAERQLAQTTKERLKPGRKLWARSWADRKIKAEVVEVWSPSCITLRAVSNKIWLDKHTLTQLLKLNPKL